MRVLIVDDWPDTAWSLGLILSRFDFQVETATDGLTALKMAGAHWPDVAILDMAMPVMSGVDLARRLKAQRPQTAIIAVSASADAGMFAPTADMNHVLVKPANPNTIVKILKEHEARSNRGLDCEDCSWKMAPLLDRHG